MLLPFPEWRPDVADTMAASTKTASNVVPRGDGYGPFKALSVYSSALPAACRGFFYARRTDNSIEVFAGTATKLYKLDKTDLTWDDVSVGGSSYATLTSTAQWQFAQFGNLVIAVQANAVPQVFDLSSSIAFANLAGSPPQAAYISVVGRFVVLTGLLSQPFRIQWSGLNAPTTWTAGVNSSDFQDLPDGGIVRGVAGGEYGVIFQDTVIRRMIYLPGSVVIFQIERVTQDKGLLFPYSIVRAAELNFFLAPQGLHFIGPTGQPTPVGKEKFDRTVLADIDTATPQLVIGAADPEQSRIYIAYKSLAGASDLFDKLIAYDYALQRATVLNVTGEYLASLAAPGATLESLDAISPSLDALAFSLDDVSIAALAKLSAVDAAHRVGFFSGANLEATIETSEQALDRQRRVRVKGIRPVADAVTSYGAVKARETVQATPSVSAEQAVNARGLCPANVSTRLARARLRIPAGTDWTFALGIEPEFGEEGRR